MPHSGISEKLFALHRVRIRGPFTTKMRNDMHDTDADIRQILNAETGVLSWKELEKHFARGVVIYVSPSSNLLDVAVGFSKDDKTMVQAWLESGDISRLSTEQAKDWQSREPDIWSVVAAPWVLAQEKERN